MNMLRIFWLAVMGFCLSGCMTAWMWSHSSVSDYTYDTLSIDGFYVNPESSELIVTNHDKAYLFPIKKNFADTLILSRKVNFKPAFDDFEINKENEVSGIITLTYKDDIISDELKEQLTSLGFQSCVRKACVRKNQTVFSKNHSQWE